MPLETSRQLTALAGQFRIPIVEDDVFGELRYNGVTLPPLRSLAPELVIYIGSFSKMLTPGLRLGWMLAPAPVIRQINLLKQSTDLHTNLMIQAVMDEFCRRDLLHRHLKRIRRIFVKRRDALAEVLRVRAPDDALVRQVMAAAPNASGFEIHAALAQMYKSGKLRNMHSWGLIPFLLREYCRVA